MLIDYDTAVEVNSLGRDGRWMEAAALCTPESKWGDITNDKVGREIVTVYFYWLLSRNKLKEASAIAWSQDVFRLRAVNPLDGSKIDIKSSKRIFELCLSERQLLVMAGGAVGKSYTASGVMLLDWARDPENTLIRVISVNRGHSKTNMFAQFQALHRSSLIELPGEVTAQKISTDCTSDRHGIHIVAIPAGDAGFGKLQGFHPSPRATPHKEFGILSRVRLILDEAAEIPEGIWNDIPNLLTTMESGNTETIKILGFFNPSDSESEVGKRAEPTGGWSSYDPDSDELEWESLRGWKIYRIDPAQTENVQSRAVIAKGMQTYEGYQQAIKEAGGINSAGYYIMCRGIFPPRGSEHAVVPNDLLEAARGEWEFIGPAINLISVDTALQGGDSTEMTFARYGKASHAVINKERRLIWSKPRYVIQVDHQLTLEKGDSVKVARNILKEIPHGQDPIWIAIDGTGTGDGVASILRDTLGDILVIIYSNKATDEVVFFDDEKKACEAYTGVVPEMWWSFRKWVEHKLLLIGHACSDQLIKELRGRRGKQAGHKHKVESKDEYKKRNKNKSPDKADSCIQVVHLVRMRGDFVAGVSEDKPLSEWGAGDFEPSVSYGSAFEGYETYKD